MADFRTYNVVVLGIGFLFIFTAFTTCGNIEQTVVKSLNNATFTGSGYHSMLFGNLYVYLDWKGKTEISDRDRRIMFIALLVSSVLGTLSFLILRKSGHQEEEVLSEEEGQSLLSSRLIYKQRANTAIKDAKTEFSLELCFYSGVYGTCIGATTHFGDTSKALIGISGIVVGFGEIVGGGLFGLVLRNNRFRRTSVVFLGMVVHFVAFYLIFLNIPDDAPVVFKTSTQHSPYLSPSISIALLCSFLLGLGDSCFNTQLYSILGRVYTEQSAPAFAIFKFVQSIFAAVAFFYSGYLLLTWQLLIMVVLGFIGTLCFFVVERMQNVSADLPEY
ncbi:hypothetical protein NFI96_005503 [Prochilodus magdalenae]|nr:hypothetical protein NFI96_005503 [Prochilodus magdalenae]